MATTRDIRIGAVRTILRCAGSTRNDARRARALRRNVTGRLAPAWAIASCSGSGAGLRKSRRNRRAGMFAARILSCELGISKGESHEYVQIAGVADAGAGLCAAGRPAGTGAV